MGSNSKGLDIFPEELFFVHDILANDKEVRVNKQTAYDGFYVNTNSICATTMTIYSLDGTSYRAKVKTHELTTTEDNSKGSIPTTVLRDKTEGKESQLQVLSELQILSWDKIKEKIIEETNRATKQQSDNRLTMKELYMKAVDPAAVKGFIVKTSEEFKTSIGSGPDVIDFINDTKNASRPWELVEFLKSNSVTPQK